MSVLLRLLAVAMLWMFATVAHAATTAEIDQARNKGLAWLFTHQNGDGSWKSASGLQMQPTTAAVEAFLNAGITRGGSYSRAASWLLNAEVSSTDSLARQIITLEKLRSYFTDIDTTSLKSRLSAMRPSASYDQYQQVPCWGTYEKYECSYPDTSLAVRTGANGGLIYYSWYLLQGMLRDTQKADGGWPYSATEGPTTQSRLIPTAYNLIAFSGYYNQGVSLDSNLTNAVNWLTARQKSDGGFVEDPSATVGSAYETALAYLALAEAKKSGIPAAVNAQGVMDSALSFLVTKQQVDGSWGGDPFTTGLALQTLPAVNLVDTDKDGIPDTVEAILGTNPVVADSRGLIGTNGTSGMIQRYAIAVASGEHGYILPFTSVSVAQGDSLEFVVAADSQYHISSLLVDGSPVAAAVNKTTYAYTFSNVAANHTISAMFAPDQPDIAASPVSLSFATLACGNTSSGQTITVSNSVAATAPLSISNVTVSGNEYLIQSNSCSGATLATGGSCSIQVAFKPRYKWQRGANVAIVSNDPDTPTLYVPLTGTGADTCPLDPAILILILDLLLD